MRGLVKQIKNIGNRRIMKRKYYRIEGKDITDKKEI
jgi:hypothetical protein